MKTIHIQLRSEQEYVPLCGLGLHPQVVSSCVALGLLRVEDDQVPADDVLRLNKILRLKRTLAVDLTGAAIIVDLLSRIEQLEDEIVCLRRGQVR